MIAFRVFPMRSVAAPSTTQVSVAMASLSDLRLRAEQLRDRSRQLARQLRDLRAQGDSEAAGLAPATAWMRAVSLRVLALSGFDYEAAVRYLALKKRRGNEQEVRDWFGALSVEQQAFLASPPADDVRAGRQLAEASKFLAEKHLVAWVKEQNETKGLAPSPAVVLEHAPAGMDLRGKRNEKRRRVRRTLSRWGVRKCSLSGGDRVSAEDFRKKVVPDHLHTRSREVAKTVPVLGPSGGPSFETRARIRHTVLERGPPDGSLFGTVFHGHWQPSFRPCV